MSQVLALFDITPTEAEWFQKALGDVAMVKPVAETVQDTDLTAVSDCTIIAMHSASKVTADTIAALPSLKLIACRSTGYDNVDMAAATKRGIQICSVPSYGETTVAEFAIMLMLALNRKLAQLVSAVDDGSIVPTELRGHDLAGKTLGVIGTGKIGRHVIATAKALGMTVVAYDPFPNNQAASDLGFEYTALDDLLATSDVITLHAPATADNNHLINAGALAKMKPSGLLINTARGTLVDSEALIEALASQKLAGAALDVVEGEAMFDTEEEVHLLAGHSSGDSLAQAAQIAVLQKLPNVILTGHNAYNTQEAIDRILQTTVDNIKAWAAGTPTNLVKSEPA